MSEQEKQVLNEHLEAVRALYKEVLDREVDDSGLETYGYSMLSIELVRQSLESSQEYERLQRKKRNKGVVIDVIEDGLALSSRPLTEEAVEHLSSNYTLCIDLSPEELEFSSKFGGYNQINVIPGAVIPVDEMEEVLKAIKQCTDANGAVVLTCDDVLSPAVMSVLWYVSQGFDEEIAMNLVTARVPGCGEGAVESMVGPWHVEAASILFE